MICLQKNGSHVLVHKIRSIFSPFLDLETDVTNLVLVRNIQNTPTFFPPLKAPEFLPQSICTQQA